MGNFVKEMIALDKQLHEQEFDIQQRTQDILAECYDIIGSLCQTNAWNECENKNLKVLFLTSLFQLDVSKVAKIMGHLRESEPLALVLTDVTEEVYFLSVLQIIQSAKELNLADIDSWIDSRVQEYCSF